MPTRIVEFDPRNRSIVHPKIGPWGVGCAKFWADAKQFRGRKSRLHMVRVGIGASSVGGALRVLALAVPVLYIKCGTGEDILTDVMKEWP